MQQVVEAYRIAEAANVSLEIAPT